MCVCVGGGGGDRNTNQARYASTHRDDWGMHVYVTKVYIYFHMKHLNFTLGITIHMLYRLAGLVPVACGVSSAPPSPAALPAQQLPPPHNH